MMNAAIRCGALVALMVLSNACRDLDRPTAPTSPADPTFRPPPGSGFPAVSRPARIYVAVASPSYSLFEGATRYVLYDDGAFALQYSSDLEYRGTYKEENALIAFQWEGWSSAGPWGATGSLSEDSLTVRYNVIMQLTDFVDGVYIRTQ